jgi:flagellar basal body-associated protein FliL
MAEQAAKKPEAAAGPAKEAAAPAAAGGGDKKDHAPKKGGDGGGGGGLMSKTPVLLGIVMILEAVVLFAGFKFLGGGPKQASAVDLSKDEGHGEGHGDGHGDGHGGEGHAKSVDRGSLIEVSVVEFKAPNAQNGRRFIYDTTVYVTVKVDFEQKVKDKIKASDALIRDRMRTIVAQMDPDKLGGGSEPGLETLRRQIKTQLEIIIGDGMIDEVLVPRCIPFRADF